MPWTFRLQPKKATQVGAAQCASSSAISAVVCINMLGLYGWQAVLLHSY